MKPVYFDETEAINRMNRRNKSRVTWTLKIYGEGLTVRWQYIDGRSAKNWDGSSAPNPGCKCLERMVWREGSVPRYGNYW